LHEQRCIGDGILGQRSPADSEHLVSGLQVGDPTADAVHDTRHIRSPDPLLRAAHSESEHADEGGQSGHYVPVAAVERRRAHLQHHVIVSDVRHRDILEMEHIARTVTVLYQGFHGVSLSVRG
jgi:hypothetical protein